MEVISFKKRMLSPNRIIFTTYVYYVFKEIQIFYFLFITECMVTKSFEKSVSQTPIDRHIQPVSEHENQIVVLGAGVAQLETGELKKVR